MKICLTTYIYGDSYQNYIPWILYSVGKTYPGYRTILFLNGTLRKDLNPLVGYIKDNLYDNFKIIGNKFNDCPKMNPVKAQSLRWVVWDDSFKEHDYLYYIDSDMLFIKEPVALHEQHIRHMQYIGSPCISNIKRTRNLRLNYSNRYVTLHNLKYGGLYGLYKQLCIPRISRLSGLHFVKTKEYFDMLTPSVLNDLKEQIYTGKCLKSLGFYDNEALLYSIIEQAGYDMNVFAKQSDSTEMLDFMNPEKDEFRPHHGIHLGIFRKDIEQLDNGSRAILENSAYRFYIEEFKKEYINDPMLQKLLQESPERIKTSFTRLCNYYGI